MTLAPDGNLRSPMPDAHQGIAQRGGFLRKYVFSADHKVIGLQYYFLALFAVLVAMVLSWVMRMHLAWPNVPIPLLAKLSPVGAPGGLITPEYYLSLLTIHGTLMIFFVLTVALQSGFGNFLLPLQIGAREMAFPRLNMLSFWITFVALGVLLSTFFVSDGPPISGWTAYPPLSGVGPITGPGEGMGQNLCVIAIVLFCLAAILGALNFVVTTLTLRARGMTMMRLPLPCWAWFLTAVLIILSFAVLVAACILLMMDRLAGTSFFTPSGLAISGFLMHRGGGSPLLWQNLFWFFGHPEVYVMILPAFGIVSAVVPTFSRKPLFGYSSMVYAAASIAILSFIVWAHHMFTAGMPVTGQLFFMYATMLIAVPTGVKVFNWVATMWRGSMTFETPMLFAIGFIFVFTFGGFSGLVLAMAPIDTYVHNTYYVIAHFHYVLVAGSLFAMFMGFYYWSPKWSGVMYNERAGKIHFWASMITFNVTFFPQHFLGLAGMVRRYADYPVQFTDFNMISTIGAFGFGLSQAYFLFAVVIPVLRGQGEKAPQRPWDGAHGLEWEVPSPAPFHTFETPPKLDATATKVLGY